MILATLLYSLFSMSVIAFQVALLIGAPWGAAAMGGKFPGVLPARARLLSLLQALIILGFLLIVLTRAEFILARYYEPSTKAIWVVCAMLTLSLLGNLATPSRIERRIWAPIVTGMLCTALFIAI